MAVMDDRPAPAPPATAAMTLLVGAVIVHDRERERVLLLRRGAGARFAAGLWDLPSGKSDPGEPVTTTAVRELYEETGVVVAPESLRLAHVIHGAWGVESPNGFLTVVLATDTWTGEPVNREPGKHARVAWVRTDSVPEEFVPSTGAVLREYLTGADPGVRLQGWDRRG
ncbi:NUDIX domain-containing protein [Streptomyces sp. SL54]|uniref:NUDIX domain-containing protein n=2 Tax=Streptantibioticus silvisoli TaxID=2705255 RepID=A0ABT6WAB4_9ACTN|nr:NUDIX domain-containing protein [Streptantibioticus silvisoli]MDI5966786.1 NUDIX domain-containing protein [Streptantibioticus silvisoli]